MSVPDTRSLPIVFQQPGLLAGGGLNKAITRTALGGLYTQAWQLNNIYPTVLGFSNKGEEEDYGIGVSPIITGTVATGKVQGIAVYDEDLIFVKNGRVYKVPMAGGNETEITGGSPIFDTSARIRFEQAYGTVSIVKKKLLYMADSSGLNLPQYYDGNSLTEMTVFAGDLFQLSFGIPVGMVNWLNRLVWFFHKNNDYRNYILSSDFDDANLYSENNGSSQAFYTDIYPGEQDYIRGLSVIKRSGSDIETQELIVYKLSNSYISGTRVIPGDSTPIKTFNRMSEIGAINHECIVNFNNNVYSMSRQGIGNFDAATTSGGIYAFSYQDGARINPLIQLSARNNNFDQAFSLHCPERQLIVFSMPETLETSATKNGYPYPEAPNDLSIGFRYGVNVKGGEEVVNCWFTMKGMGWGWSCGCVNEKNVFWGDYIEGQIYKWFSGTEFQRNPSQPETEVPFTSRYETGDMVLETPETMYKNLLELILNWYVATGIESRVTIFYDGKEEGQGLTYNLNFGGEAATYGTAVYGTSLYSYETVVSLRCAPSDGGRKVRIKIEWNSKTLANKDNLAALDSFIGTVQYGKRLMGVY